MQIYFVNFLTLIQRKDRLLQGKEYNMNEIPGWQGSSFISHGLLQINLTKS